VRYHFIHAERANYPLWLLCFVLCVSRQGYYSWLTREQKATDYTELDEAIKAVHKENRRRYGTRRQVKALAKRGFNVSRKTVRKRMVALGLKVRYPKAFRVTTSLIRRLFSRLTILTVTSNNHNPIARGLETSLTSRRHLAFSTWPW
jgi:hypothetical protein